MPQVYKRSSQAQNRLAEKDVKSKYTGSQGLLLLIGFKVLIIIISSQNIVTSDAQGNDVDQIKVLNKDDQTTKHWNTVLFYLYAAWSSSSKFWPHQHQETLSTQTTIFYSKVNMIKTFKLCIHEQSCYMKVVNNRTVVMVNVCICDLTWENSAYVHTKFDFFIRFWILMTFCLSIVYQWHFC